jgi:hypothetical protein
MKIARKKLVKIIYEEMQKILKEEGPIPMSDNPELDDWKIARPHYQKAIVEIEGALNKLFTRVAALELGAIEIEEKDDESLP